MAKQQEVQADKHCMGMSNNMQSAWTRLLVDAHFVRQVALLGHPGPLQTVEGLVLPWDPGPKDAGGCMGGPGNRGGGPPGGGPPSGICPTPMLDLGSCVGMKSDCMGGFGSASGCDADGWMLTPVSWPVNLQVQTGPIMARHQQEQVDLGTVTEKAEGRNT